MADYKSLYLYLFGKLTNISNEIIATMQEAEKRFLDMDEIIFQLRATQENEDPIVPIENEVDTDNEQ